MKGSLLPLLEGTLVTIELTILSLILGLIVAVPLAFGQIYGNFAIKFLVSIYERVVRSIPLIVILFLVHYGLPRVGIRLTFFCCQCSWPGIEECCLPVSDIQGGYSIH